ncbi:MAG: type II secretion system F family protein [Candidatus Fermentithermobacillus carboniphilus]|uniref:Type II secretion system F family protein n=1 Tax=Candidatus Fermentithermobacillus carboniphilus TaxID=3085328 RepID=A0AAT9LEX6_9FIRM|nr:MAG: type II secretion system F family protein [Candidatus Fermentithermobacillus carboniphilus]
MRWLISMAFGTAVFLMTLDMESTFRIWTLSPSLAGTGRRSVSQGIQVFLKKWVKKLLSEKREDVLWEEIALSLAFHIKAGETLVQAVKGVSEEGDTAGHRALGRVYRLYGAGTPIFEALDVVSGEETGLGPISDVVHISAESGGDLPTLLCHASDVMRQRRTFRGEVRAKLAEVKITAVLLSLLPWVIGFFLLRIDSRMLLDFARSQRGKALLGLSFILWSAGNVSMVSLIRSVIPPSFRFK